MITDTRKRKLSTLHLSAAVFLIRCYQAILRPFLLGTCKFHPTCSEYAADAIREHGLIRGGICAIKRLARCHPFGMGGYDPVPPRRDTD